MCKPKYPCDVPDAMGEFHCPYEAEFNSSGYACRNHCGLGVDEDSTPDEELDIDFPEEPEIDESMNPYDGTYDWENDCTMIGAEDW